MTTQRLFIKKMYSTQFIHRFKDAVYAQPILSQSFRTAKHAAGLVRTVFRKVVDSHALSVVQYLLVLALSSVLFQLHEFFVLVGWMQ